MESRAVLRNKYDNKGIAQYYAGTKKEGKNVTILLTDKLEDAFVFASFGQAGLAAQKPEVDNKFEAVELELEAISVIKQLRAALFKAKYIMKN